MAAEWELRPLFEVADVAFGYPFDSKLFNEEALGLPLIRIRDLRTPETCLFTTEVGFPESTRVRPGDLLVGMDAEFRPHRWAGPDALLNQRVCRLEPTSGDRLDREFLRAAIRGPLLAVENAKSGTTVIHLNKADLERVELAWPPPTERRAIAHILGTLDDKIELNRRMSETLEAMARALFNSWFVDFDPVRAKAEGRDPGLPKPLADLFPARLVDSELGEIPEGWEIAAIGELLELAYGRALRADNRQPGPIPVFGSNGQVGWHDKSLVAGPGIVVGRKGNPGVTTWVSTDFFPIDTSFFVVPKAEGRLLEFLFFALRGHDLASLGADSAVPGLNRNLVYMSKQLVPPAGLLEEFGEFAGGLFERMEALSVESRTLTALRDTLLPRLMSGELRVPTAT